VKKIENSVHLRTPTVRLAHQKGSSTMNYKIAPFSAAAAIFLLMGSMNAEITAENDDFVLGKVVAKNDNEMKNNANFVDLSGLAHLELFYVIFPYDALKDKPYWLQPKCKVATKQSNGSFVYGVVSAYSTGGPDGGKYEVTIDLGNHRSQKISVGFFGEVKKLNHALES
jgi:hypothetical protein